MRSAVNKAGRGMASGESVGVDAMQSIMREGCEDSDSKQRVQGCWTARCATAAAVGMTDDELSGSQAVGGVKN